MSRTSKPPSRPVHTVSADSMLDMARISTQVPATPADCEVTIVPLSVPSWTGDSFTFDCGDPLIPGCGHDTGCARLTRPRTHGANHKTPVKQIRDARNSV